MRRLLFLTIFFLSGLAQAETTKTIFNPHTNRLDFITVIAPNITPGSDYTGFTFNGTDYCLYVNGVQKECWSQAVVVTVNYALLEDDTYFLLEDDSKLLLEQ